MVHTDWNGCPLSDVNFDGGKFESELIYDIFWSTPDWSPNGVYKNTMKGMNPDGKINVCVIATFTW